jgi:hypothetical protein
MAATNTDTMNSREGKSMTSRNGGEGGILTQPLSPSYHVFSNIRKNRINIVDSTLPTVSIISRFSAV